MLRLNWDKDVDLAGRSLTFRRTKNGKMRTAHIPDPLLAELSRVSAEERHGPMFAWSNKCHVYGPLKTACKKAGLEYLGPHQLGRHTYATWLRIYAKRDLRGLQADGGWDSIASVARYAHVVPGETAKAVDLLPDVQTEAHPDIRAPKDRRIRKKRD